MATSYPRESGSLRHRRLNAGLLSLDVNGQVGVNGVIFRPESRFVSRITQKGTGGFSSNLGNR